MGIHPVRQVPRARQQDRPHPGREVPHPAARRLRCRGRAGHGPVAVGPALGQRARGLPPLLRERDPPLEGRRVPDLLGLLPALDPLLRRADRRVPSQDTRGVGLEAPERGRAGVAQAPREPAVAHDRRAPQGRPPRVPRRDRGGAGPDQRGPGPDDDVLPGRVDPGGAAAPAAAVIDAAPRRFKQEPMLISLLHRTTFTYASKAQDSFNEVRLRPVDDPGQSCRSFELRTDPASQPREYIDFYGNTVHYFDVVAAHSKLVVEAVSEVETTPNAARRQVPKVDYAAFEVGTERELHAEFLTDSHFVPLDVEIW